MKYLSLIFLIAFLAACSHTQEAKVTALEAQMNSLLEEKAANM
jgi:hypothetical protein